MFFWLMCFVLFLLFYPIIINRVAVGTTTEQMDNVTARVAALEEALKQVQRKLAVLERAGAVDMPAPAPAITAPAPVIADPPAPPVKTVIAPPPIAPALQPDTFAAREEPPPPPAPSAPHTLSLSETPAWLQAIKTWLFTGNLVAKFGLLILIIGIGFLVKYTAQHVTIPIELRLAGVVVLDIGLLLWGWRIRLKRRDVALPVQGAAVAILMIVVFGAFQRLFLIPAGLAFPLLVALTVFTCVLALLQDAIWLAVFGIAGGFAAPLLVSSGSGNQVALFSYYALLDAGILALALRRSWRVLNLLGFGATFLIGGAWGVTRYTADHYASSQGFLILFFLFYVGIAVAWAWRRAPRLNDAIDTTLVFGTPAAAFSMQYGLVHDMPFGMAFSSLASGLFYLGVAALLRRARQAQDLLVSTFIALATLFGTLAIPFALSGALTSAAWALEGAGLIWVGLRQQRVHAWRFGLLVQCGAWIAFLHAADIDVDGWVLPLIVLAGGLLAAAVATLAFDLHRPPGAARITTVLVHMATVLALVPIAWNGASDLATMFLGATMLAASAVIAAALLRTGDGGQRTASHALLTWAGAWWFLSALWWGATGLARFQGDTVSNPLHAAGGALQVALYTVLASASALAAVPAARKLAWQVLRWLSVSGWAVLTMASGALLYALHARWHWPTLPQAVAWAIAWLCGEMLLRRWTALQWPLPPAWQKYLHLLRIGAPWLMLWPLCARLLADWLAVDSAQQDLLTLSGWRVSGSWAHFMPAWVMIGVVFWLAGASRAERWPTAPIGQWYRHVVIPAAAGWFMLLALFWNLQQDGAMAPLPYLPLLNPLDLSTGFALLLWMASHRLWLQDDAAPPALVALMPRIAVFAAWGWLNMILLRTAAHYLAIDYRFDVLASSVFIQAMLSLAWAVSALVIMRRAGRPAMHAPRKLWMLGAALLGIVVAKLFLVDLANSGTIARIVSFVGVGLLMVVIGYLAPYPNAPTDAADPDQTKHLPAGSEA
jgi:uncharacterized membrane protein